MLRLTPPILSSLFRVPCSQFLVDVCHPPIVAAVPQLRGRAAEPLTSPPPAATTPRLQ